jgi:rhamnosyltransferase subunit B
LTSSRLLRTPKRRLEVKPRHLQAASSVSRKLVIPRKFVAMRLVIVAYGSLGDLHPAIALAHGLKARGHHAAIASSEPYRAKITGLGLPFHAVRPDLSLSDEEMVRRVMDGRDGSEYLMRTLVYPAVRDMHADLAALAPHCDAFIAGELACAAPIVGATHRKPWAFFALSPVSFLPVFDPSVLPGPPLLHALQAMGPGANRFIHFMAKIVSHSWWKPIRELRREVGLPAGETPLFAGKMSPHLNLALFSAQLQRPQPDWPKNAVQTGFLFHDEAETGTDLPPAVCDFLEAGPPPIVFTLGSAAVHLAQDFYGESAHAARMLGCRALLLLGKNPVPPNLPASILAVDYLPYAKILPHAAAVVHQGGIGTTGQTLRAGRPMLVVPFAHDQFDNGARITRLGVGATLARKKYCADSAARELGRILSDPRVAEKARALGAKIRAERGIDLACEAIERMVRR